MILRKHLWFLAGGVLVLIMVVWHTTDGVAMSQYSSSLLATVDQPQDAISNNTVNYAAAYDAQQQQPMLPSQNTSHPVPKIPNQDTDTTGTAIEPVPPNRTELHNNSTHPSSTEEAHTAPTTTPDLTPQQHAWLNFEAEIGRNVSYVTARFHAEDGKWKDLVDKFGTKLLLAGFPAARFHPYADRNFPSFIRNNTLYREHLAFLDNPRHASSRGAGYWFWKPVLIHHHLTEIKDGDFLIYADADDHTGEAYDFKLLQTLARDMVASETTSEHGSNNQPLEGLNLAVKRFADGGGYCCPEKHWNKGGTYQHFCPGRNQTIDNSGMYVAGFVMVKKTPATVELWNGLADAAANYSLVNDVDKRLGGTVPTVKDHRHDQSLLSCTLKCRYDADAHRTFVKKSSFLTSDLFLLALSPWGKS